MEFLELLGQILTSGFPLGLIRKRKYVQLIENDNIIVVLAYDFHLEHFFTSNYKTEETRHNDRTDYNYKICKWFAIVRKHFLSLFATSFRLSTQEKAQFDVGIVFSTKNSCFAT